MIETSLLMSSAHLLSYFYTEYWMEGTMRKPMGTANHLSVPYAVFPRLPTAAWSSSRRTTRCGSAASTRR